MHNRELKVQKVACSEQFLLQLLFAEHLTFEVVPQATQ